MKLLVAVDDGAGIAEGLRREGEEILAVVPADALESVVGEGLRGPQVESMRSAIAEADAVVLEISRATVSAAVVALCDGASTRIVPLCADVAAERLAAAFGLERPAPRDVDPGRLADLLRASPERAGGGPGPAARAPRLIAVWGPAGSPGRSTVSVELAVELARGGRHVGLVDADTHAPSIALALGLADEGPGFAAACRQSEFGGVDAAELTRVSVPLGRTGVDVLTGINRPSRWPELSETRVTGALAACRGWAESTVVDIASSLERDEEIVSDLDGPRRNAATLAALRAADLVVAVAGADPVGVARFLRAYPDLRATIGATPVLVLANQLRPGALGIDARGQVRRTLERFAGIERVWFLPQDPRSVDAALLSARPVAEVAPKSPFTLALRRFVGEGIVASTPPQRAGRGIRRAAQPAA